MCSFCIGGIFFMTGIKLIVSLYFLIFYFIMNDNTNQSISVLECPICYYGTKLENLNDWTDNIQKPFPNNISRAIFCNSSVRPIFWWLKHNKGYSISHGDSARTHLSFHKTVGLRVWLLSIEMSFTVGYRPNVLAFCAITFLWLGTCEIFTWNWFFIVIFVLSNFPPWYFELSLGKEIVLSL